MPFNGSGVFGRLYSWVTDAGNGLKISSSRMDQDSNDIASGLSNCMTKDGQQTPTANLKMAGFRFTGLGSGVNAQDSATLVQAQSQQPSFLGAAGGTANALTGTGAPTVTSLADGSRYRLRATANNTGAATLAIDANAALNITYTNGAALQGGEMLNGGVYDLTYAAAGATFQLLNPSRAAPGAAATLASASTTDLGTASNTLVSITGTTTITSFGSSANANNPMYMLIFGGALTLTYNASSLITPTGNNIVTTVNDVAHVVYLGSGNWQIVEYFRASGASLTAGPEFSIASAATCNVGSGGVNGVTITGTTAITSFGSGASAANPYYFIRFQGALLLTYNSTSLILPGNASITTAAGDTCIAQYMGSGNWKVISYAAQAGTPVVTAPPYLSIGGFIISGITGTATTDSLSISAGGAADSTGAVTIRASGATSWAVSNGNAANGYQGGTTLPNSSTIHIFMISGSSGVAAFGSTSTSPTLPSGYSVYRRVGSFNTNSSGTPLVYTSDEIEGGATVNFLNTPTLDVSTTTGPGATPGTLYTLNIPSGIKVRPLLDIFLNDASTAMTIASGDEPTPGTPGFNSITTSMGDANGLSTGSCNSILQKYLLSNTSAQIRAVAQGSTCATYIYNKGWIDPRRM